MQFSPKITPIVEQSPNNPYLPHNKAVSSADNPTSAQHPSQTIDNAIDNLSSSKQSNSIHRWDSAVEPIKPVPLAEPNDPTADEWEAYEAAVAVYRAAVEQWEADLAKWNDILKAQGLSVDRGRDLNDKNIILVPPDEIYDPKLPGKVKGEGTNPGRYERGTSSSPKFEVKLPHTYHKNKIRMLLCIAHGAQIVVSVYRKEITLQCGCTRTKEIQSNIQFPQPMSKSEWLKVKDEFIRSSKHKLNNEGEK